MAGMPTPATLATSTLRLVALVPVSTKGGSADTWVIWTNLSTTLRRPTAVLSTVRVASGTTAVMVASKSNVPKLAGVLDTGSEVVVPGGMVSLKVTSPLGKPATVMA